MQQCFFFTIVLKGLCIVKINLYIFSHHSRKLNTILLSVIIKTNETHLSMYFVNGILLISGLYLGQNLNLNWLNKCIQKPVPKYRKLYTFLFFLSSMVSPFSFPFSIFSPLREAACEMLNNALGLVHFHLFVHLVHQRLSAFIVLV